jgi:hypothetical protein
MKAFTRSLVVGAVLSLSACTGAGRISDLCGATGGHWVGAICQHQWTRAERAEQAGCEGAGGVYLQGDDTCAFGEGGP